MQNIYKPMHQFLREHPELKQQALLKQPSLLDHIQSNDQKQVENWMERAKKGERMRII